LRIFAHICACIDGRVAAQFFLIMHSWRSLPLVLGLLLCLQAEARGATVIGFEGYPDSTIVTNQYPGLTFTNTIILTVGISLNEFEFPPHSGVNVASDNGGPITITFSPAIQGFSGYFTYSEPLALQAFDSNSHQVASASSHFSNNEALSGVAGSSPNELMSVASNGGISKVTMTGDPAGTSFTLDDATVTATTAPSATPAPTTLLLTVTGLALVGLLALRRKTTGGVGNTAAILAVFALFQVGALWLSAYPQESQSGRFVSTPPIGKISSSRGTVPGAVTVSIRIDHPDYIGGSVNLIRFHSAGAPMILGPLVHGDNNANRTAGSHIYTIHVPSTILDAGQVRVEVSAAFRARLRRIRSEPVTLKSSQRQ
jgi:hypothetical protein